MAEKGVDMLSTSISEPIPSWHDMIPGSRFLQSVFSKPLSSDIQYYLLFSYLPETDGDGVVEITSQLLPEAQSEALDIRGYHAGHVDILFRDDVFEYVAGKLPVPKVAFDLMASAE